MREGEGLSDFPAILVVAGPQAAAAGVEAGRVQSLWRALCQCAETWRLNLWPDMDAPDDGRVRHVSPTHAEDHLRRLIEESGVSTVILAGGADVYAGIFPPGVRIIGLAGMDGAVPSAAEVIWAGSQAMADRLKGDDRSIHVIAEAIEPGVGKGPQSDGDAIALIGAGGQLHPDILALIEARGGTVLLPASTSAAVEEALPGEVRRVPGVIDAVEGAAACILVGAPGDMQTLRDWCILNGRSVLWPADESGEDALAGDPAAALASVVAALGLTPPEDAGRVGALVARNLGLEIVVGVATFNPRIRLLHCAYDVTGQVPPGCLTGNVTRGDGSNEGLVNAWVQEAPPPTGFATRLRATAALEPGVEPGDIAIDLMAWGWPLASYGAGDAIEPEVAGIIGLKLAEDGQSAEAAYWGLDIGTEIQFGRKRLRSAPVAIDAEGTAIFRTSGPYPLDRATLTVFPPEGQGKGQRFTRFRLFDTAFQPTSKRLSAMKNSLAGRTGWLVGNGPSVRTEDLDRLAEMGATCFCFNRFHLAHEQTKLRPQFTVTGDLQMIEDFGQTIVDESGGTVFVADEHAPSLVGDYVWVRQISAFPSLFSFDADLAVTPGGSSVYVAMQIGYFLGIRRWYLYGSDFSFQFSQPSSGGAAFRTASGEGNHFIANYRSGRPWCPPAIENILPSFFGARMLMELEGGFIRNATRGGHLNVFERVDFEEALMNSL